MFYDPETNQLFFEAYDETLEDWGIFELTSGLSAQPLGISWSDFKKDRVDSPASTEKVQAETIDGHLYLTDLTTSEQTLLKRFYGITDFKFAPGHSAYAISPDEKFVFYSYNKHLTSFGAISEGLFFDTNPFEMRVLNLETGKESQYLDFSSLVFIP